MLTVPTPREFVDHVGRDLGTSDWFTVEQHHIDDFARITGDDFWIHVDVERARRERPDGRTIAHGLYLLSLVPWLQRQLFTITQRGAGLNYGSNKVRYTAQVPVGSRVRLHQRVLAAERHGEATRLTTLCEIELEGSAKPAVVAEFIVLFFDA